jgi:hypothetical protein
MKQQLITRHSTDDLLRPHAAHSTQLCAHCSCSLAGVVLLSSSRSLPTLIDSHYTYVWLDAGCWMEHAFRHLALLEPWNAKMPASSVLRVRS